MIIHNSILRSTIQPVVEKGLDAAALRQKAMANNFANLDTPGYRRIDVKFEEQLKKALDQEQVKARETKPPHMPAGRPDLDQVNPKAYRSEDITLPGEVNNVDVDIEMAKLASNSIAYQYNIKFLQNLYSQLSQTVKGVVE